MSDIKPIMTGSNYQILDVKKSENNSWEVSARLGDKSVKIIVKGKLDDIPKVIVTLSHHLDEAGTALEGRASFIVDQKKVTGENLSIPVESSIFQTHVFKRIMKDKGSLS